MDQVFAENVARATQTQYGELGYFITLDTTTGDYGKTLTKEGDMVGYGQDPGPSVLLFPVPTDSPLVAPNPVQGTVYILGAFHTHPPSHYNPFPRGVGPSGQDITNAANRGMPSFVYDYEPASGDQIPAFHPASSPARVDIVGPNRRAVPEY
jgi:hypothetical protein